MIRLNLIFKAISVVPLFYPHFEITFNLKLFEHYESVIQFAYLVI